MHPGWCTNHCASMMIISLGFAVVGERGGIVGPRNQGERGSPTAQLPTKHPRFLSPSPSQPYSVNGEASPRQWWDGGATSFIIIACGVIGRSARDSWLPSRHQLHVTSSQGCWQQPPLVIRRPQPSHGQPRRWDWSLGDSEAFGGALPYVGISIPISTVPVRLGRVHDESTKPSFSMEKSAPEHT